MKVLPTDLPGVLIIEPDVSQDTRGFFLETYHAQKYREAGIPAFVQDNHSHSARGTLRGLHAQRQHSQGKLSGRFRAKSSTLQSIFAIFYYPTDEIGIAWNDPKIGIKWPIQEPILSDRDRGAARLSEMVGSLRS